MNDDLNPASSARRRLLNGLAGAATLTGLAGLPLSISAQEQSALAKIRARGSLIVAVYKDMPPFNDESQGIDVDLAAALAKSLDLKLSLLPFQAGESVADDLRNMVWKGHYLGFGPADVLLHVPVDAPLIADSPQVTIFAPYYRERVMIARDLTLVAQMPSLGAFTGRKIAVPGQTLSGWLLIGADGGAYKEQLVTALKDGCEAAQALLRGEVAAAAGTASELESVLGGNPRYAIEPLPLPRMRDGWPIGCAVKRGSSDLAQAVQAAMNDLAGNGQLAAIFGRAKVGWRKP
jgi:ABC-type amino acid transport substrate-binding protein